MSPHLASSTPSSGLQQALGASDAQMTYFVRPQYEDDDDQDDDNSDDNDSDDNATYTKMLCKTSLKVDGWTFAQGL